MEIIFSLENIHAVAIQFVEATKNATVFAFHGDMGAGKTTFVKAICKALGVLENISSPTYSIINQYKTINNATIYHIDLYRLKNEDEAIQAGVEDCLLSGNICFVEWPERAEWLFNDDCLHVNITAVENDKRKIEF